MAAEVLSNAAVASHIVEARIMKVGLGIEPSPCSLVKAVVGAYATEWLPREVARDIAGHTVTSRRSPR
jgi:hypothetical protein